MMSEYKILKLRSGEEIITSIVGQRKQKFIVERPFTLQNTHYLDMTGVPRDIVRLRSWLKYSNQNTVHIPKDHIATFLDPDENISRLYDVEKEREDTDPPPNIVMKKDVKKSSPDNLDIDEAMVEQIMKDIVDEMKNAHSSEFENENIDDIDELTGFPKNKDKKDKEFIVMNMVFPPSLLEELMKKGLIDSDLFEDLLDDTDEDDDDEEEISEPRNGEGFTEEKTNGDGSDWTDWSFEVKDYLDDDEDDK